jgi:hypothetical protein
MRKKVPGFIRDVRFRDVILTGRPGEYLLEVEGADSEHDVRDVAFDVVSILGAPLTSDSQSLRVGRFTEGVTVGGKPSRAAPEHP